MAITRSQIARQLMQEGGVPRQGYFLGKLVRKIKDDIIPNELKTGVGKAATAAALGYGLNKFGIPGTSKIGTTGENIGKGSISNIFRGIGNIFTGGRTPAGTTGPIDRRTGEIAKTGNILDEFGVKGDVYGTPPFIPTSNRTEDDKGLIAKTTDFLTKKRLGTDKSIAGLLMTPQALAIGSGLLAGAFTKDKDDPAFTGQDVGLNLRDIRRLANVTDPKTGQAIGLSFLPDVEARKFTPTEMAASFAAGEPMDFTEQRQQAQEGGMMGDQKDFEEFLQDKMNMDKDMLQDRIMRDFENYMKRKRMIEQLPEAKDGGIMKAKPKKVSYGYDDAMAESRQAYDDYKKRGVIPKTMTFEEFLEASQEGGFFEMADGGSVRMASYGYNDAMSDTYSSYLEMKKKGLIPPTMTFDEFIQEVVPEMSKRQDTSGMMASAILGDESDEISMGMFGKPVKELNPDEFRELMDYLDDLQKSFRAKGGIIKMAGGGSAGSRYSYLINKQKQGTLTPDEEQELFQLEITFADESQGKKDGGIMNLGGMEMDLRGGGFVPMGAKEKADDVPARLSKNEFVFTADAVRAAGGGDVNKGADKMYATMKKLEDRVA